ncbi:hypothetical protein GCM10009678_13640 [Actinomadura kijaniata]
MVQQSALADPGLRRDRVQPDRVGPARHQYPFDRVQNPIPHHYLPTVQTVGTLAGKIRPFPEGPGVRIGPVGAGTR